MLKKIHNIAIQGEIEHQTSKNICLTLFIHDANNNVTLIDVLDLD